MLGAGTQSTYSITTTALPYVYMGARWTTPDEACWRPLPDWPRHWPAGWSEAAAQRGPSETRMLDRWDDGWMEQRWRLAVVGDQSPGIHSFIECTEWL